MNKNLNPFNMSPKDIGYDLTLGVISCLIHFAIACVIIASVAICISNYFGWGTDSTDKDGWNRSGLTVHRDALTGVEYVSDGNGGMCVRQLTPEASTNR